MTGEEIRDEGFRERLAVVLFNIGGPDRPAAVRPFLRNMFSDPAIIKTRPLLRWFLARLISWVRAPTSRRIYARLGGGSPLLPNTEAQAAALSARLGADHPKMDIRCFPAMRYWQPMISEAVRDVADWAPDRIVLLPLYPQFSTTTTASSFAAWDVAWNDTSLAENVACPVHRICCYPDMPGFLDAIAEGATKALAELAAAAEVPAPPEQAGSGKSGSGKMNPKQADSGQADFWEMDSGTGKVDPDARPDARILFSAHGLPQKVVDDGDPYVAQVERTAELALGVLEKKLSANGPGRRKIDSVVCYQSRVGPVEWTRPYTADEIERAGREGRPVAVVPVAFVSENSETLDELDNEYRELAAKAGVPAYARAPTASTADVFIKGLAMMVSRAMEENRLPSPGSALWRCPKDSPVCPFRAATAPGVSEAFPEGASGTGSGDRSQAGPQAGPQAGRGAGGAGLAGGADGGADAASGDIPSADTAR